MANTMEDSRDEIINILDTIVAEANRVEELTAAMRDIVAWCDSADEDDWKKIIDQIRQIADAY